MRTIVRSLVSKIATFLAKTPLKDSSFLQHAKSSIDELIEPDGKTWIDYRGYELLVDPSDHLGRQLWTNGEYEPEVEEIINEHLEKGDTAFDIGANLGQFTICMREAVGKSGTVYAFEPLPKNTKLLNETLRKNSISNVEVINKAVGKEPDTMELFIEESNTGNSTFYPNQEYDRTSKVDIIPLSDYTKDFDNIKFIKVDVEGAELDVLKGLGEEIRKIDYILLEIHYYTEHHKDYNIKELFNILNPHGSIFGFSTAPKYESVEARKKIQTPDELSHYDRIVWVRNGCPPKIGQKA